jgi:hypothetical protein
MKIKEVAREIRDEIEFISIMHEQGNALEEYDTQRMSGAMERWADRLEAGTAKSQGVDRVLEAWREDPTERTAANYLLTTLEYVSDDMLEDESLYAAVEEVGQWLISKYDEEHGHD